jgi:glucose 1-dehydrogenase
MTLLLNKVAVITGGTRGIGLAIAQAFGREGASVVIASRSQESVEHAVAQIGTADGVAAGMAIDVSQPEQVKALADLALSQFGRLDIWVNNAGTSGPYGPTVDLAVADFTQVLQTNILGVYHGSRIAVRHFRQQGSGKLINVLGAGSNRPLPLQNAYGSTKTWVRNFTKALAKETNDIRIGVYAFQPGLVFTELISSVQVIDGYQSRLERFPAVIRLLSRQPEAVAGKVVWLASSATDSKTGLEVRAYSTGAMLWRALRVWLGSLGGKPQTPIELNIKVIPPAED